MAFGMDSRDKTESENLQFAIEHLRRQIKELEHEADEALELAVFVGMTTEDTEKQQARRKKMQELVRQLEEFQKNEQRVFKASGQG